LVKKELANGVMYFRILICLKLNLVILCFFDLTLLYFIEFVACTIKKRKKEKKIASATGAENRTMSQLIFNPNKY